MKTRRLTGPEIEKGLKGLDGWVLRGSRIEKRYAFEDFRGAMALVLKAALCAEAADHHPDIDIRYTRVLLSLSTHSAGGLTQKDLDLAADIDS